MPAAELTETQKQFAEAEASQVQIYFALVGRLSPLEGKQVVVMMMAVMLTPPGPTCLNFVAVAAMAKLLAVVAESSAVQAMAVLVKYLTDLNLKVATLWVSHSARKKSVSEHS